MIANPDFIDFLLQSNQTKPIHVDVYNNVTTDLRGVINRN
jgi:hypothetical protein